MTRHQSHRGFSSFLSTETLFFRTNLAQQRDDERLIPGALRHRPAIPVGCIVGAGRASRASEESRAGCGGNGEAVEASAAVRTVGGGSGAIRKTPAETGTQEGSLQTAEAMARARAARNTARPARTMARPVKPTACIPTGAVAVGRQFFGTARKITRRILPRPVTRRVNTDQHGSRIVRGEPDVVFFCPDEIRSLPLQRKPEWLPQV